MLLAPGDTGDGTAGYGGNAADTAHQDAHAVVAAARALIAALEPAAHPLVALETLHRAAAEDVLFAPSELSPEPIAIGTLRLMALRAALPSPRWALEMLWGEHWRSAGLIAHALPFPGLIRLDAIRAAAEGQSDDVGIILARALREGARSLHRSVTEADQLARHLATLAPGRRRSSRAPALLELLAGFGPMRSAQLEVLLGVTRLGLRTMLNALDAIGVLERRTLAGVRIYAVTFKSVSTEAPAALPLPSPFSSTVLGELDAAMADIDALLARSSVRLDAANGDEYS